MGDAITGYIVERIGNYLIGEASKLIRVKDELETLKEDLRCFHVYLTDDEAREREDKVSKEWAKRVLDIAYDAEDALDTYFHKDEERSKRLGLIRCIDWGAERELVAEIGRLKSRISDATRRRDTFGVGNLTDPQGQSIASRRLEHGPSVDQGELVVGFENEAEILSERLFKGDTQRSVISIYGMGGMGKTTLAMKLFNSTDVKRRFEYRGWTRVSQKYKPEYVLLSIIRSLGVASNFELEKMGEDVLESYLNSLLRNKKYLVVIDDVWEKEVWDSLKRALPCNGVGSRVIITTRIKAVAEGPDRRTYAHDLRFLTYEASWKLLQQKADTNVQHADKSLKEIGEKMLKQCGGLPLAIAVLGGILSKKSRPSEWNDVYSSLWRHLKDKSAHISTVTELGFKEMPHELKLCFFYLSVFPKDYVINVDKLIRLLVAEGFVQDDGERMMEDVARDNIQELIDRSFVQAESIERGKVISCRIHDLMRDSAIKKAKELDFVHVYNNQNANHSSSCRREVVHHIMDNQHLCHRPANKKTRSFLFFGESVNCQTTFCLKRKLLRVLDFGRIRFVCKGGKQSLPDGIDELIHLRYITIFDNNLLAFISNLRFLQTLDASGNDSFRQEIYLRKLTSLRHVIGTFVGDLLIGDAVNLQTLRSISSYSWSKLNQEPLRNLRNLTIHDSKTWVDQIIVDLDLGAFSSTLREHLRVLNLEVRTFKLSSERQVRFSSLVELTLSSDVGSLPKDMFAIFPILESLTLVGSNLKEDPMPALMRLEKLEYLVLKNWDFPGRKMCISAQGFGQLRKLELIVLGLLVLQVGEKAMPRLTMLNLIKGRRKRETKLMIPDRLRAFVRSN